MTGMFGVIMIGCSLGLIFFLCHDGIFKRAAYGAVRVLAVGHNILSRFKERRYSRFFDAEFPDALLNVSSALKAGCGLMQAIEVVSKEMTGPVAREFEKVLSEVRLGAALKDGLDHMCERVASDDLLLVVQSVDVLKETGGNLIEAFETIASTIQSRRRVAVKIKTITSEGLIQAYTLLAIPFCLGAALWVISPEYLKPLIGTRAGVVLIAAGVVLQVSGFLWMRKIARVVI